MRRWFMEAAGWVIGLGLVGIAIPLVAAVLLKRVTSQWMGTFWAEGRHSGQRRGRSMTNQQSSYWR